jgi:hypothetical protein
MLLRSISSHVRSQNWLAVALDFVIVVTGIFVGLQADAWNESRKDRISERAAIEQLLSDFTANGVIVGRMVEFHAEKVEELTFAMNVLIKGELAPDESVRFRSAYISMFQLPPLGATMGGYDALIASGDFALIQDQELRSMLVELNANLEAERSLLGYFRDMNNTQSTQPARDLILVVPTDDRSDSRLQVDFSAAKDDLRILTIVSGQRRNHQVFEGFRRNIATDFENASNRIKQVLGEQ